MSTLPGQASKGEKTKSKFQSLDINSLYRVSRGENLEKQQQKSSSVYIKHGMQSLGKVPNARRAPANLPSLKAEHSGSDAAVPLVPPGAPGWGKQEAHAAAQQPPNTPPAASQSQNGAAGQPAQAQASAHQAAAALPATNNAIPHPHKQPPPPSSAQPAPVDKLWSSVMSGHDSAGPHPPLYHSPQFRHEFPSLSAGEGGPDRAAAEAPHYPAGLSLRPQTEGSWTQGGQRPVGPHGAEMAGQGRPNSAHPGVPPQHTAQAGQQPQQNPFPPQMRGVMPSFMYKGSSFQPGPGNGVPSPHNAPPPANGRPGQRTADGRPPRLSGPDRETEEAAPRPIIKEEELTRMDEIGKDMGWAESDEIDYNQKLAFSDDESDRNAKKESKRHHSNRDQKEERTESHGDVQSRQWGGSRSNTSRGRTSEEEDIWMQRRNQTDKEVEMAVQRAKQRKEEEEKRFQEERKQAAAKKLMELEQKIQKRDRDGHEGVATINPVTVPPKPINHVDIPLPNFQKDKEQDRDQRERDSRSRTPNEPTDDKNQPQGNSFRQLAQIQGKSFPPRKHTKLSDNREQNAPNFSRHFQSDLPPRFLKQHNNNSNSNLQNQQQYQHQQQQQFDNRWSSNNQNISKHQQSSRNTKQDSPETEDHKDYVRQSSEDSYRSSHHSQQDSPPKSQDKTEKPTRKDKDEDKWQTNKEEKWQTNKEDKWQKEKMPERKQSKEDWTDHREKNREDWSDHRERIREEKQTEKYERERERPQRTDSRDSRSRDYMGAWSESPYEHPSSYEEKRRDHDRRVVPGPITKERIEADDMRNEKRNLTQLKRGQQVEVRSELKKLEEEKKEPQFVSAWADSIPPAIEELQAKKQAEEKKHLENLQKLAEPKKQDKADDYNRNKPYGQKKGWGNAPSNDYQSSRGPPWQNRRPPSRSRRQYHGTDSDGSMEDHHQKTDARNDTQKSEGTDQKSPNPMRKNDKEERSKPEKFVGDQRKHEKPEKKDNYVPRGEPSRHGRGGGNFRSGRMASISKKIDGYGPPPAKSPFGGHHEEKEVKKPSEDVPAAENPTTVEDKIKQNQQALAAGIIGKRTEPALEDKSKQRPKPDLRKNKPKSEEADKAQGGKLPNNGRLASAQPRGRNNPPPRSSDKRYDSNVKQPVAKKDDAQAALANAIADITLTEEKEETHSVNGDSEGFQEVKSKKAVKERQKSSEDKPKPAPKVEPVKDTKPDRDRDRDRKGKMTQQLTQQQIQNIPSLMATPVNPPPVLPQTKNSFDRGRQTSKLPPRLAKQKLQKQAMQQHQHGGDLGDANKGVNLYGTKEAGQGAGQVAPACAWDKPLVVTQLRGMEHEGMLGAAVEAARGAEAGHSPSQLGGGGGEKMLGKPPGQPADKPLLDGSTAPVNTIIFENTNFKSAPGQRSAAPRPDKARAKPDEPSVELQGFGKAGNMGELLQSKGENKSDAIQLPLFKEDGVDMKLDFFSADLQFGDDKTSKNFVSKSIHAMTSGNNTVDSLDIKIASVKKVWETSEQEGEDTQITFGGAPLDSNVFNQSKDGSEDNHEVYSPSPSQTAQANVCKVKPTQQVSGGVGQPALGGSGSHQPPHNMAQTAAGLMGNPLSPPPPMQAVLGAGVGMGPQYTANQHIGYQTGLSGSTQYGISAIPSPPTVPLVYNSTQQLQNAVQTAAGLYGAFQLDQLSGQGSYSSRSQFSQYANYHGLGQTASSPYTTPNVYLPTPPHPPPPQAAQAPPPGPPPPELYQNMNSFRLSAQTPFGQSQQLSNPTTVLISSTSNSLMSASVKPSGQQISAIGTKAGGVGQAYQQQSQQGQQVFMTYDPTIQANYLASNAGVMQRAPVGPAQNNVVPGLQPSSSYYSGSTGGQTGFFQPAANSSMPSAQQLSQHQAGYGLQGNVFGQHAQSHANAPLPNYNSHFLTAPMQVAAALNAQQQYRSGMNAAAYLKGVGVGGGGQEQSQGGRSQQLKSPGSQEVLSSVFNSGPQIPSPKSRQNMKHPPQQSSPTSQHKYNMYQGVGGPQNMNMQRYPTPIQRPINFQQMQQNSVNQKHRNNPNNKPPNNRYYSNQNHSLSGQSEKCDDEKINDNGTGNVKNNAAVNVDKVKENMKEEPVALKD